MNNFKKVINPCKCDVGMTNPANAFAEIEYKNKRLSIHGVIGPKSNGDCRGSCGQCVDEIRHGTPTDGWTREMLNRFCDIWDEWHLNDLHPYCEHQKKLGWREKAGERVTLYNYTLSVEALHKQDEAKNATVWALKKGATFVPTAEQTKYANLEYSIQTYKEISGELAELYVPKKSLYSGDEGATETKMLGWLYEKDHPDGLLAKPCPVCGYKYGTKWQLEEIPENVLNWLLGLPDTKIDLAWI